MLDDTATPVECNDRKSRKSSSNLYSSTSVRNFPKRIIRPPKILLPSMSVPSASSATASACVLFTTTRSAPRVRENYIFHFIILAEVSK